MFEAERLQKQRKQAMVLWTKELRFARIWLAFYGTANRIKRIFASSPHQSNFDWTIPPANNKRVLFANAINKTPPLVWITTISHKCKHTSTLNFSCALLCNERLTVHISSGIRSESSGLIKTHCCIVENINKVIVQRLLSIFFVNECLTRRPHELDQRWKEREWSNS